MPESSSLFSIWTQESPYWLVIEGSAKLPECESIHHKSNLFALKTSENWRDAWIKLAHSVTAHAPLGVGHRAAVIAANELPPLQEINLSLRNFSEVDGVANNLWLIEDVNQGRLGSYMQRVIDRRGKIVGYEAFARMESADGGVIGGGAIMQAATALKMEFQLDRLLHRQAIESFVEGDLEGNIFINFLTGFIHRPEVYLDGLSQAAIRYQVRPGAVVLDVPVREYATDLAKLKSIADFCRVRGFALALDDVSSPDGLAYLLEQVRPAFVKLDGKMGSKLHEPRTMGNLREIVRLGHAMGASIIAEAVENKEMYDAHLEAEVDMFQGYYFGAPERFPRVVELKQA